MALKKTIEVWTDYDRNSVWRLNVKKQRGRLTLEEIREACMDYSEDFYLLVICAMDLDMGQYYEIDDLMGDFVQLYRAGDFFRWRDK